MKDAKHIIVGIHITNRMKKAKAVQKVLTKYGCHIKTRLGLHEVKGRACESNGIILLEVVGCENGDCKLIEKLAAIKGVDVKEMVFTHP